jgi:hypothetical protein
MDDTARTMAAGALRLVLIALATGCGGQDRPVDDGGDDDTGPGGCSRHESCEEDELCTEDTRACEPAYGRSYRMTLSNVSVHRTHSPDGSPWDEDGGLPDLYLCLTLVEAEHCTAVAQDTNTPQFDDFVVEAVLEHYQHIEVELCDDDTPADPQCWIVAELESLAVPTLRAGTLTLIPDDPSRLDDWAVTLSFHPLAL